MSGAEAWPLVRWLTVAFVYGLLIEIAGLGGRDAFAGRRLEVLASY